ncbi:MAG: hypothetical protein RMA76_25815 [Deltaproteobacteria bacterium]|jgi:hypothetical protein
MTERFDFVSELRHADAAIAALGPPPRLGAQIRARLERERTSVTWPFFAIPFAAIAALFVAVSAEPPRSPDVARFTPATCAPASPAPTLSLEPGCSVQLIDPRMKLIALDLTELRRTSEGFVVNVGRVEFNAELTATPFTVYVATRRLEAIAARFEVDGDTVHVHAGRVVVHDGHGGSADLAAGDALSWAEPEKWSNERIEAEVRRTTQLRVDGDYERAVELLEQLLASPIGEDRAAVLSYERASLLETRLGAHERACAQFEKHRARFGRDRYAAAVDAALERCP